jgi:AMMECR1 domain-containing protein
MGATFVTLTQHGQLRGCIGSLEAWRPCCQTFRKTPATPPSATRASAR